MHVQRKSRRGRAAAAFVALGCVAALPACSSSHNDVGAVGGSSANGKSTVLIAALVDVSGPSNGNRKVLAKVLPAWEKYANAHGGIGGHPVHIEIADTQSNSAKAASLQQQLASKHPIAWLLDSSSTEASQADFLSKSGIPIIGGGYSPNVWGAQLESLGLKCSTNAGAPLPCALPNAFTTSSTFGAVLDAVAIVGQQQGATKVADVVCAEIAACSSGDPELQATLKKLDLKSAGLIKVSNSASSYTSECVQLIQQGTDLMQLSLDSGATKFAQDCIAQGYQGWVGLLTGAVCCAQLEIPGVKALGDIQGFPWWVDDAPVQAYRQAMADSNVPESAYSSANATADWAALQLFAKANAQLSDNPTAAEAMNNMYSVKNETLDGLLPPITFTKGQSAQPQNCFWPYVYQGGKFTNPLGGLKYECYPKQT